MSRKLFTQQRQQSTTTATAAATATATAPTWLLCAFFFSCTALYPLSTQSSPVDARARRTLTHTKAHDRGPACAHDSVAELIRASPVILKALGAHIFSDDDFNGVGLPSDRMANEFNSFRQRSEFAAPATLDASKVAAATTASAASTSAMQGGTMAQAESILITLTPETIYKGASLLKMSPGSENGARRNSFISENAAEAAALNDGQLNATLQPAHCFDGSLLHLLPTELIVFGKLITMQQQQQQQQQEQGYQQPQTPQQQQFPHSAKVNGEDILHISINGFHRWSPQFENHIWQHLGWDDWSDFTLCSVTCGKGVQQRFRRCLLDDPMVNLNTNANADVIEVTAEGDDDIDDDDENVDGHEVEFDVEVEVDDDDYDDVIAADNNNNNENTDYGGDCDGDADAAIANGLVDENMKITNEHEKQKSHGCKTVDELNAENTKRSSVSDVATATAAATATATASTPPAHMSSKKIELSEEKRNFQTMEINDATPTSEAMASAASGGAAADELGQLQPVTLTSDNNEHIQVGSFENSLNADDGDVMSSEGKSKGQQQKPARKLHKKRRKATKGLSTMFCEGYNIEQRNCNTFECSDDISDLLKFYGRPAVYEDAAAVSPAAASTNDFNANIFSASIAKTDAITSASIAGVGAAAATIVSDDASDAGGASVLANSAPSTTPANMGYIRSWHNPLNFTIMLTLRVKNDSRNSATIFSIRNATHNLYLDQCQDGLRLYLERDSSTEMLPVKFQLYDYRWHQVAISIQNGDFISIYVDCSWTNSFVVSKRLFTLPLDADVEIGRGFYGELQQLLLMPDNQERYQCSSRRTSINEVKRYIIDTFIGDYGN